MEERIVIKADEKICKGCDTCLHEPRIVAICNLKNNLDIDLKKEQIPETFEELKEMCKNISVDLKFTKEGTVYCYEHCIAENRTPAQMWEIIKSLIGEE